MKPCHIYSTPRDVCSSPDRHSGRPVPDLRVVDLQPLMISDSVDLRVNMFASAHAGGLMNRVNKLNTCQTRVQRICKEVMLYDDPDALAVEHTLAVERV